MKRWIGVALWACSAMAHAVEFQPLVHIDMRGGYGAVVSEDEGSAQGVGSLFAVPALKLSPSWTLLPTLYANATGQERSIEEDTLFVRTALMGFRPTLKLATAPDSAWIFRLDARKSLNVEAVNESFGTGLYDYEDFSAGVSWQHPLLDLPVELSLDTDHRDYPNYRQLGSELTGDKNSAIKDYNGLRGGLKVALPPWGQLRLSSQWKDYTDAYIVNAVDGTVDTNDPGQLQHDLYSTADLEGGLKWGEQASVSWGLGWQWNSSNQNSFDPDHTDVAGDNANLVKSQDYMVWSLDLSTEWQSQGGFKVSGGYSLLLRDSNRPVQDINGVYQSALIADTENGLNLNLSQSLGKGFSLVGSASDRWVISNQVYQAAGLPNYSFYSVNAGIAWDWQAQE
jgi:hypothetical protein